MYNTYILGENRKCCGFTENIYEMPLLIGCLITAFMIVAVCGLTKEYSY